MWMEINHFPESRAFPRDELEQGCAAAGELQTLLKVRELKGFRHEDGHQLFHHAGCRMVRDSRHGVARRSDAAAWH